MGKYERELKRGINELQSDLDKDRAKKNEEKQKMREYNAYKKLPDFTKTEFWCNNCEIDFVAPAHKIWIYFCGVGSWHSYCPICGGLVYRHITAKKLDPYYGKSEKLKQMRGEAMKDILQPDEYGFRSLYGDPFEHYYLRHQHQHELLTNKYYEMGLLGKTLAQKQEEEDLIMREVENY